MPEKTISTGYSPPPGEPSAALHSASEFAIVTCPIIRTANRARRATRTGTRTAFIRMLLHEFEMPPNRAGLDRFSRFRAVPGAAHRPERDAAPAAGKRWRR